MLAGVLAGLLAFGFAKIFGEPQVDRAIGFEEQMSQAPNEAPAMTMAPGDGMDHHATEEELVSRQVQSTIGLFTGVVVVGTALGGLFALVFAFAYGRIGRLSPRVTAALLAAAGFISFAFVPGLKYPANPPSVGAPETIGYRTELYFAMVLISLAAAVAAIALGRRLIVRHGGWNAALIAAAAFLGIIVVAQLLLPAINEVPDKFPADLLWRFRVVSFGIQLILWTTIGLTFGILAERSLAPRYGFGRPALS
jgi:pimeloyl-ACP methyl ester carboxylesterase